MAQGLGWRREELFIIEMWLVLNALLTWELFSLRGNELILVVRTLDSPYSW